MSIKIILHDVRTIDDTFSKLTTKRFPNFKAVLQISKAASEIKTIRKSFDDQERAILLKYMKTSEDGNFVFNGNNLVPKSTDPKDIAKLNKELNDLHSTSVELENLKEPLMLDYNDGLLDLTPNDLIALQGLVEIVFDEPTPEKTKPADVN